MTAPEPQRPLPTPTRESKPYWEGMKEGRLRLQHCAKCGKARHYPKPVCPHCYSMESQWQDVPLDGTVNSWTVCHHPFNFFFKQQAPYVVALVDMVAGVRVNAPLRGVAEKDLRIGLPVRLAFEPVTAEVTLPYFVESS